MTKTPKPAKTCLLRMKSSDIATKIEWDSLRVDIKSLIADQLPIVNDHLHVDLVGWVTEDSYLIGVEIDTDKGCLQDTFRETRFTGAIWKDSYQRRLLIDMIAKQMQLLYTEAGNDE